MPMLPIFLIGLVLGSVCTVTCMNLKKDIPSVTRLELLEKEISILKNDKIMLENCVRKRTMTIDQLRSEIAALEEKNNS